MLDGIFENLVRCYAFGFFVFDFDLYNLALWKQMITNFLSYLCLMKIHYLKSYHSVRILNQDAL